MSLTLPYPSMVFVPLDVLTADEMNHIVANYEFIANQFPITSDNIDSATIVNSNIAGNTITLDKMKMPRITVAGVDGNQQSSTYKITFDPNVEPYTIFVGTVYVRHNMPSTFRITVGATTGVISSAVFTDSTNFSATTSGNTVTVTYSGGQWSMFYLAYMEYKATMGMTITRE